MYVLRVFILWGVVGAYSGCAPSASDSLASDITLVGDLAILPVGGSRVEGDETAYESYRFELWKKFRDSGIEVDFVGSRKDQKEYPLYKGEAFDLDHEGRRGDRTDQMLERITAFISYNQQAVGDAVLLGGGGNDLIQGQPVEDILLNMGNIILALQGANGNITIFLEKMAPGTTTFNNSGQIDLLAFESLNNGFSDLAFRFSTPTSKVVIVDMSSLLVDSDYADGIHYNTFGAQKVANQYFEAIKEQLYQ